MRHLPDWKEQMAREITVRLECCGASQKVTINEQAILAGEPNEVRKNVVCPDCANLVILEFKNGDGTDIEQEVIYLGMSPNKVPGRA